MTKSSFSRGGARLSSSVDGAAGAWADLVSAARLVLLSGLIAGFLAGCATAPEPDPEPEGPQALSAEAQAAVNKSVDLAQTAINQGRHQDAQRLLEAAIFRDPTNTRAKLLFAELLLARGRHLKAANGFSALLEEPEVRVRALQGRGIASLLIGDEVIGEESLREALAEDESLWRAWNALGYLEDKRQNWAAAVEAYDRAIAIESESAILYNNRGYSMMMQRRVGEAIEDLNTALRLDPDLAVADENLRLAFAWDGRYIHALSGTSTASMGRVLNNIGYIALLRGDYPSAESYLVRAMEVDPRYNAAAAKNLAYLRNLQRLERDEGAKAQ